MRRIGVAKRGAVWGRGRALWDAYCGVTAANQKESQHNEHRRQTRECRMHSRLSRLDSRTGSPAVSSYVGFYFDEEAVMP